MANLYANITRAAQTGTDPGYKSTVYFAVVEEITTMGRPIGTPAAVGDKVKITDAHVFASGKHAWAFECKIYSPKGTGTAAGDPGEKVSQWSYEFVINGDNPATQEMLENLLNENVIVLFPDADCQTADSYVQLGDDCKPVDIGFDFDSGNANATQKKRYTVKATCPKKFFYEAALTIS